MPIDLWLDIDEEYRTLVDAERLETVVRATLARMGVEDAELSVLVTSDEAVQSLNRDYRANDTPTDVLSFPAHDSESAPGDAALATMPDDLRAEVERQLGDVIIAFPYASRQATHFGNAAADELLLLAVHGTLHLLGHDHATHAEETAMWALQEEILADYGVRGLSQRDYDARR